MLLLLAALAAPAPAAKPIDRVASDPRALSLYQAEPHRCEAVMLGPIDKCDLPGDWIATGTGKTEVQARKHALVRLRAAVVAGAQARDLRAGDTMAVALTRPQLETCGPASIANARLYCYREPELLDKKTCFADLPRRECWQGIPLDMEGVAWKMLEQGRDEICEAVDKSLERDAASEEQRVDCRVQCLQQSKVRCAG